MTFSKKIYSNIYLRIFVILLCCVFVFQLCSVEAHASATLTAAAVSVIASILVGIGVSVIQDNLESSEYFNQLCTDIANDLFADGTLDSDSISVFQDAQGYTYAPGTIVQRVIDWLQGERVVFSSNGFDFASGHTFSYGGHTYTYSPLGSNDLVCGGWISYTFGSNYRVSSCYYLFAVGSSNAYRVNRSTDGMSATELQLPSYYNRPDGSKIYIGSEFYLSHSYPDGQTNYIGHFASDSDAVLAVKQMAANGQLFSVAPVTDAPLDVSGVANFNALPNGSISDHYPAWRYSIDENTMTPGFSIVLRDTVDEVLGLSQSQVQVGEASIDVPGTGEGTDTGTIAQWLENIWKGIQALPQSIATSVADSLSTKIEPEQLQLNLTEFFPFCIPFDIYEFFAILAADPVAPVFEWTIPVPQLGTTYDFEIDLSVWDPVAQLFRTMELLAFCVGLAFFTRDKFTRG